MVLERASAGRAREWSATAVWIAVQLAPGISAAIYANAWDSGRWQVLLASVWIVVFAWAVLPRWLALVVGFALGWAGALVVSADLLRGVNLLELVAVAFTFARQEIRDALGPYLAPVAIAGAALLLLAAYLWRARTHSWRPSRRTIAALVVIGVALGLALPAAAWRAAWPLNLADALMEWGTGDLGVGDSATEESRASPRDRFATWHAKRTAPGAKEETYLLVIGESLRAGRLPACGGRREVKAFPPDAIVYCDVLAGSGSTHLSVPLLVSRDMPGAPQRVPKDATVARAFEEAGFETFWLGVQHRSIAWPDAKNQAYEPTPGLDRKELLPLAEVALRRREPRKFIVLHAYGAHGPYAERYEAAGAPFKVDRSKIHSGAPTKDAMGEWWNDYDNAASASVGFVDAVIERAKQLDGEVFLAFTPDHAENMLDDDRGLVAHALKRPTWWDTRVPLVFWANDAWKAAHAQQWVQLAANRKAAAMHMDVVPTLLGAAGIAYEELRSVPVDLTARAVPSRARTVAVRPGEAMNEEALKAEAGFVRR